MCSGLPPLCGELHKNGGLKNWWRALWFRALHQHAISSGFCPFQPVPLVPLVALLTPFRCFLPGCRATQEESLFSVPCHIRTLLNLSALPITLTDERAMAAAAMIGDSKSPNEG